MNHLIADNKVSTLRSYLIEKLSACYEPREAVNVAFELFQALDEWSRAEVILNAHQRLGESQLLKYHFALKRLLRNEPIQYVLGYAWFLNTKFVVDNHVLIPRPETEELVKLVVTRNTLSNPRILDVGTGSGCIAIGLKKLIPNAIVTAIDVSEDALTIARKNASILNVDIEFETLNILSSKPIMKFDIIVSNPPYIPPGELNSMNARVTDHEPHLALFTPDSDSLVFYRRLMDLSTELLTDEGKVYCEIHENMAEALLRLAENQLNQTPVIYPDLQGKNRLIYWTK
jgi:release factor glutamine methyltransferase